ncbi:MAG: hypothetical protein ACRD20_20440 [Terriglobales bacterium]
MSVATTTAIAIGAGVSAAGAIGGAAISSHAAGEAADKQVSAAEQAAQLQKQEADNALDFQKQEWSTQQQNEQPWLNAGNAGISNLLSLLNSGPGGLLEKYPGGAFTAPTLDQAKNEPGYQFAEQQGEGALQNSAAAKGGLLSGNTLEALNNYAQKFGEQDYSNVYNRAQSTYDTNYNVWNTGNTNSINRLLALAGMGQTANSQLGTEGQQAASNVGNIDLTSGAQQGQDLNNAAAAMASGYVGSANAWSGALGGSTNNLMQLAMMNQLLNNNSSSTLNLDNSWLDVPDQSLLSGTGISA